jgi:starch synthase (maltosyl-transferring)
VPPTAERRLLTQNRHLDPGPKPLSKIRTEDGRRRAIIEALHPCIDAGRFPIKRTVGDCVGVEALAFGDGHERIRVLLLYRKVGAPTWREAPMIHAGNDRWQASFTVPELGQYAYTAVAWVDRFMSWRHDFNRRVDESDRARALRSGAELVAAAAARAAGSPARLLRRFAGGLETGASLEERAALANDQELEEAMQAHADRSLATTFAPELRVVVEPLRARYGAWYEMFPRSTAAQPGAHGTFADCIARLPYIAEMGFDILYLPPIHPIGRVNRKGRNNTLAARPDDPGSPWAIGADEGGHKAIHPELGSEEDLQALVEAARFRGIAVALDIAFQCAPDHPYLAAHPEWFRRLPDGTLQYAENPPKKYEDIYPFDFETADWHALWQELRSVFQHWIDRGVRIFRVDNPHTKPFAFWEWVIAEIKRSHPDVIFLSEAFTRPSVMHHLAKLGFSQSYTYFAWRNTKSELESYFTELADGEGREYLHPNAWPNTPDILTEYLQKGGRPAFMVRLVLASTLASSYGIYGPAFELCEGTPREPGSEEYLNSEKYEIKHWDIGRADSLAPFIGRVNAIRRANPALQSNAGLRFHPVNHDALLCYSKATPALDNIVLVVVNLDPARPALGWVDLPLEALGLPADRPYQMHDALTGARYSWSGRYNQVTLDPASAPAHIFVVHRFLRNERNFDYYL